jgi:hypothetical protein
MSLADDEGRIRHLCYRAAYETNDEKLELILVELRDSLRLRIERVREMAATIAALNAGHIKRKDARPGRSHVPHSDIGT